MKWLVILFVLLLLVCFVCTVLLFVCTECIDVCHFLDSCSPWSLSKQSRLAERRIRAKAVPHLIHNRRFNDAPDMPDMPDMPAVHDTQYA